MRLRPIIRPIIFSPLRGIFGPTLAPDGAILHYDADLDAFAEQTGGPHTFNHAVLSPQYQRNADGSYTDVGAKPAVDVFDGEKWLRSCGAYTNALPTGAAVIGGPQWIVGAGSSVGAAVDGWYPITTLSTTSRTLSCNYSGPASGFLYFGFRVKAKVNTTISVRKTIDSAENQTVNLTAGEETIVGLFGAWTATLGALSFFDSSDQTGNTFDIRDPFVINLAYPVPYVPPGVTQPASNATTTNGMWFSLPDGSPLWQALTGGPLTLATRVRMGVGSGDLPNSSVLNVLTPDDVAGRFLTIQKDGSGNLSVKLSDGTNTATVAMSAWNRNDILDFFPQVLTGGTQMRVGYKTKAATSITWGDAATYAGTFGPDATLKRLMVGYANAYPMWLSRITSFPKQATDAEAMGALV